jgi:hypothetical protein
MDKNKKLSAFVNTSARFLRSFTKENFGGFSLMGKLETCQRLPAGQAGITPMSVSKFSPKILTHLTNRGNTMVTMGLASRAQY